MRKSQKLSIDFNGFEATLRLAGLDQYDNETLNILDGIAMQCYKKNKLEIVNFISM